MTDTDPESPSTAETADQTNTTATTEATDTTETSETTNDTQDLVSLSLSYLAAARSGDATVARNELAAVDSAALDELSGEQALAVWLNVYNATAHSRLREDPTRYERRRRFFSRDLVTVAGTALSLDDIEHGILRGGQWKYGLGYVPDPFPGAFVGRHRLVDLDERIHFALNCGATSCPLVRPYEPADLDADLDRAARTYLADETVREGGTLRIPRILLWFRGDFGGRSGIFELLERYGVIEPDERPRIRYRSYDWSLELDAFADSE